MITQETDIEKEQELQCYHCGNPCSDKIAKNGQYFCCNGCKTVFEILSNNQLQDYYQYESTPGISMLNRESKKFDFLDNEEIVDSLLDFQSTNLNKITLFIPGIHCSSCIWLLENLHKLQEGVKECRVNFMKKEAVLSYDPGVLSIHQLADVLDSIGYGPLINWDSTNKKKTKSAFGTLQIKLGIAGFCFGNIMLLSFPEYFGFELPEVGFRNFFSYLNLLLALPVLLYSSTDYLRSALKSLQQRYINIDVPIAIGILTLFTRSAYEVISQTGPGFFDSFSGFIFFLLIGKWFQDKTYESLSFERDFKSYFPLAVSRVNGTDMESVPVRDLRNGDTVKIRNNEIIPTDSILLSDNTNIDYSFVTGEQMPMKIKEGETIFAGGRQKGVDITVEVAKPVSQSYLTSLWNNSGETEELKSQRIIDKVARYFTAIVLVIALGTGIYWGIANPGLVWESVTAVLIVACPCALALSVPFTYGNILRIAGRNKMYLKSTEVVEKFNKMTRIVFDKTGTLTWPDKGEVRYHGTPLEKSDMDVIKSMASASFHPLSKKLSHYFGFETDKTGLNDFEEIPGSGLKAEAYGKEYLLGNPTFAGKPQQFIENSHSVIVVSIDHQPIGWFELQASFRDNIRKVVNELGKSLKLSLLSGDNDSERKKLEELFPPEVEMMFQLKPDAKRDYLKDRQSIGEKVIMVGDGLNDAPALGQADVGIAITDDVSSFSPACDAIFDGRNFSSLDRIIRFIQSSRGIVIGSFIFSFLYNITGLTFAVTGELTPIFAAILMPLSSISILIYTTLAVNISARLKRLR